MSQEDLFAPRPLPFEAPVRPVTGAELRDAGLRTVEAAHSRWIDRARAEAVRVARATGSVHIDDVRAWSERTGDKPDSSRAWGAVWRGGGLRWRCIGVRPSSVPSNRAHASPVWALVTEGTP